MAKPTKDIQKLKYAYLYADEKNQYNPVNDGYSNMYKVSPKKGSYRKSEYNTAYLYRFKNNKQSYAEPSYKLDSYNAPRYESY